MLLYGEDPSQPFIETPLINLHSPPASCRFSGTSQNSEREPMGSICNCPCPNSHWGGFSVLHSVRSVIQWKWWHSKWNSLNASHRTLQRPEMRAYLNELCYLFQPYGLVHTFFPGHYWEYQTFMFETAPVSVMQKSPLCQLKKDVHLLKTNWGR